MRSQICRAVTQQLNVLTGQKGAGLSRYVRARIAMVKNDSCSHVRCLNFSKDFRQTNYAVPFRIDRPAMLKWNSRHMTSFAEETGYHLLRGDFPTNNFQRI